MPFAVEFTTGGRSKMHAPDEDENAIQRFEKQATDCRGEAMPGTPEGITQWSRRAFQKLW